MLKNFHLAWTKTEKVNSIQGRIQDFKLGGGTLKKIAPSRGRHEIFGVFCVKNHDFTPKNHIFFNCQGRRENFWGISCEKSRFYAKKNHIFSNFRGGRVPGAPPPKSAPGIVYTCMCYDCRFCLCFYNLSIWFWNISHSVVFFGFHSI
jgi:hypothetical protein